ncbi:MAG: DUF642 domain-containing protein [Steroidobacteraceae bacterium]
MSSFKVRGLGIAVGAALAALVVTNANASLVTNGDFANIGSVWVNNTGLGSDDLQYSGATDIPGWTNVPGYVNEFWFTSPNDYSLSASPGNGSTFAVDLTGQANNKPYGGIEQTITTVAGEGYELTFDLGASTYWNSSGFGAAALTASANGTSLLNSQLFTLTPDSTNEWVTDTLSFTADSSSTTIEFLADSSYTSKYVGLDNVNVNVSAVPEPSTWTMLLAGLGGLAAAIRFRRKRVSATA